MARLVGARLAEDLGQSVIVDNRGGGGSTLGTGMAARATPDGYTLLISHIALAVNQTLYSKLPYRAVTDLAPISTLSITSLLNLETLAVQPADKANVNDIANVAITLGRPVAVDAFAENQGTGAFLIIDAVSGASVAGGVITTAKAGDADDAVAPG